MQYFFILGNTPKLSALEIKSIIKDAVIINETDKILIIETKKELATDELINTLGGTVKIGLISKKNNWQELIQDHEENKKTKFGFSFYALSDEISDNKLFTLKQQFRKTGLAYKKELRSQGQRAELIESRDLILSSVIISKEKCLDILVLVDQNNKIIYGQTFAIQPFREFSHRDFDRPNKDIYSGMLPPKVARMMINIAGGKKNELLLDPFCGSGTVVQEALLLGYQKVIGSDISEKAVADTENNLNYLNLKNKNIKIYQKDAAKLTEKNVSTIVAEVFLGPPNITPSRLPNVIEDLTIMYSEIFTNLKKNLAKKANLVIAFPAWRFDDQITHLPMQNILEKLGYKLKQEPLLYGRPDARVLREIYIMNGGIQ